MKKLAIVLLLALCACCIFAACDFLPVTYEVTSEKSSYTVTVGQQIDYKSYFTITNSENEQIVVTDQMIDASKADTSKPGAFIVTCSYKGDSCTIIFVVEAANQGHTHEFGSATCTLPATCSCGATQGAALGHTTTSGTCTRCGETIGNQGSITANLSDVFANYTDYESWNFEMVFDVDASDSSVAEEYAYTSVYLYDGYNFCYTDNLGSYADYVIYTNDDILYYYQNDDGSYSKYSYNNNYDDFSDCYNYIDWADLAQLGNYQFVANGNYYSAVSPSEAGNAIIGEYTNCTYTTFDLYVSNGKISKIVAYQQDNDLNCIFTYTIELSKYGTITVDVSDIDPDNGSSGGGDVGGDDDDIGGTTTPSQQEIVVEFATSTGSTTLNSTGEVYFTASRAVDNWEADRGLQFEKQKGTVTLTSTTTVNNVATIVLDVSANKTTDVTITVKVGNTVFTCNGQSSATFQNIKHNILTFTTSTPVSGVIQITAVPAKTNTSGLGSVYFSSVTISATGAGGSGGSGNTPSNTMPEQTFNPNNHVDYDDILSDAIKANDEAAGYLPSTALPSQGEYNVLVIPVEFSNDTFTTKELNDLNDAFNNKANTGWESVSSYYNTSSYGKLNLTFDIVGKVSLSQTYQNFDGGNDYGADILKLALDMLEARGFDFTKYDYDNNGVIDGVYIIYSAPIDYDYGDYYWAYVTATDDETLYDDLYAYTYLFASVDFMYEDIETSNPTEFSPIDGLKLNAVTYIHETGHMLGLDDYYDYNPNQGSDEGLGGSDMMDYTVGDHNAYSKLLLGWVKPTAVVTTTQTITISNFESSGQFIVVLLDYDGTYFSEYLIIDLYSATGLNALHAGVDGSYLYDGASFGARIYHVDATINNPYSDDYYSFTDNNNSISKDPLIKLVEADGDKNFESDQYPGSEGNYYGFAAEDDLWQTGDVFSQIQANYTRNDGKVVNFDITFVSISATSATITITFNTPQ